MVIAGFLFILAILGLELAMGVAVFGFTGGKAVVVRADDPGKFWFSIVLQLIFGLALPAALCLGSLQL
ncbi:hypothetical protein EC9_49240 [Rosistilla ulvae]|uniref:Uncharacterized protein n=2 Tax=Rosistilla ulvae TaxID=1930277 RepID=A0A517M743_9BACT|nr:hypothetical protein EC9_49240 [Rosistilla ulvae]